MRPWVWLMVAGFVVLLTIGLQIGFLRDFFQVQVPSPGQWALIGAVVLVGIAALLGVRRIPWLRRLEAGEP